MVGGGECGGKSRRGEVVLGGGVPMEPEPWLSVARQSHNTVISFF